MRYAIDLGHNCPPDVGAMGGLEDRLNKELGEKVQSKLIEVGHEAVIVNPRAGCTSVNQSLRTRCENANTVRADRFISIHFNAFNTKAFGTEVFYTSSAGQKMAEPVVREICDLKADGLQFANRGAKQTSHYYVLNATNAPAILIETCFCDNGSDLKIYNAIGVERVASAIVRGLTGQDPDNLDQPCICIK